MKPLVAPDGSVYYQLKKHELAGLPEGELAVPAREIIHDRWNCAFHPLVGLSPLYACGGAALEANTIQNAVTEFFSKGGRPSGLLIAPTEIDPKTAERLATTWHSLGPGKTAIVGYGMKYQDIGTSAVDSQLTEQRDGRSRRSPAASACRSPTSIRASSRRMRTPKRRSCSISRSVSRCT